jgi:hypothetical protein
MRRKLDATGYDSDKSENTHYLRNYEEFFEHLVDKEIKLLELVLTWANDASIVQS